jgi:two-component system sensor histidine kinase KdpD
MTRGQLRVYLGSAPGVGKTYRMLDEGWRRHNRGTDVVIGYVETHQRPSTDAQVRDLEVIPRVAREYRGAVLEEMDLEALLVRKPEVALVDELAHTNVPGGAHEKRWQDVEALLDAGIDVITTVNIQHLESVNDVVEKITGITQQETVPDAVVRAAEQIELVDVTPEALRRRMAHGNIYAADKIDASLSNYFRVGNLSALRELALLWLADRVEDALQRYQDEHEIGATWETRERLIVGVTGSQTDEVLLRRAARIASRTGAEMIAVHVVSADGPHRNDTDTTLAQELVAEFEGTFQEIVEDDTAMALVAFARSERGTQIVLGASRPRSSLRPLGGVVHNVLRRSRDLDVHIIAVGGERPARVHQRRQSSQFSWRRQTLALALAAVVMPLVTVLLTDARASLSLSTEFLVYLVIVLALTTWGGVAAGVVAALAASALENYYFVKPLHTLEVARPDDVVSLVAFLLFAVGASVVVSKYTRRSHEADRARAEAQVLAKVVGTVGTSHEDLLPLLDTLRAVFAASGVAILTLRDGTWEPDVVSGEPLHDVESATRFAINEEYALVLEGASLRDADRQLVSAFAGRIAVGLRVVNNAQEALQLRAIADAEVTRTGMVRGVSNDLRESLSTIQFKLTSFMDGGETAPVKVQRERLGVIESEVQRMNRLVGDLIDVGRLETGDVTPRYLLVSMSDLLKCAISTIDTGGRTLDIDLADELPKFMTDPELAERAIAVVIGNACRFSPADRPVRITAGATGDAMELLVIDRGPGIERSRRAALLDSVPRRDGESSGVDLGLTVATGSVKLLGGDIRFEDTPGGGLTVILEFPLQHEE